MKSPPFYYTDVKKPLKLGVGIKRSNLMSCDKDSTPATPRVFYPTTIAEISMIQRPKRSTTNSRPRPDPRKLPKNSSRPRQGPEDRPEPRPCPGRSASGPPPVCALRPGPGPNRPRARPGPRGAHVAPLGMLAESAVEVAMAVERAVLGAGKHADRAIAAVLRERRGLALPDHRFITQSVFALFRWRGWIDPLHLQRPEARLLLAWLLDATNVHPACRVWAGGSVATRASWSRWAMRRTGRRGPRG